MPVTQSAIVNGLNVQDFVDTVEAIKATPEIASFKFRVRNEWIDCGLNRSTVGNFYGALQEHEHQPPFVLDADEHPVLLGRDQGANPVEYLLHALVACLTSSIVYHAAAKGIVIQALESEVEGDLDLHGFLGIDPQVRCGYQGIRIKFRVRADGVADDQIAELIGLGPSHSPVCDSVSRGVPVLVSGERM